MKYPECDEIVCKAMADDTLDLFGLADNTVKRIFSEVKRDGETEIRFGLTLEDVSHLLAGLKQVRSTHLVELVHFKYGGMVFGSVDMVAQEVDKLKEKVYNETRKEKDQG